MARTPDRRVSDGAIFFARTERGRAWLATLVPLLLVAALLLSRAHDVAQRATADSLAGGVADLSPAELSDAAADVLEAAVAKNGSGYTFEITQWTSLDQKAGGPLIDIPHPIDRGGSLGKTDHYELTSFIERGAVTPDGFWLEIRDGPARDAKPDFEKATYQLGAIVREGVTYRNDGEGWYETADPPGIGLDPQTAALLPTMLREATGRKDAERSPDDAEAVARKLEATTKVVDVPGLIAVDAAAFTELIGPLELSFDDAGRLISIHAIARNTNLDAVDMVVDTTITFTYPADTPDIPIPDPIIKTDTPAVQG